MPFLVLPESQNILNGKDLTKGLLVFQREGGHEVDPGDSIQVKYTAIYSEQRQKMHAHTHARTYTQDVHGLCHYSMCRQCIGEWKFHPHSELVSS